MTARARGPRSDRGRAADVELMGGGVDERGRGQGRSRARESPSSLLAGRRVCPKCPMGGVPLAHPLEGFPSGGMPRGPVGRDGWTAGAVPNKNSVRGVDSDGFQWGGA